MASCQRYRLCEVIEAGGRVYSLLPALIKTPLIQYLNLIG